MEKKLNLGCGKDYREGWVNVDSARNIKADVYHDLNELLPFNNDTFDIVLAKKSLEDVKDINRVIEEIWRVLKPGGVLKIHCTFGGSIFDYHYIFHKNHLIPKSFDIYVPGTIVKDLSISSCLV